jgi:putative acetyltransferase
MYPFYGEWKKDLYRTGGFHVDTGRRWAIPLKVRDLERRLSHEKGPMSPENPGLQIAQVEAADALDAVRALFQEYWDSFGFTPCFQNFGEELAGLPGAYAPPSGRLALAKVDEQPAGCIAFRRMDSTRAEPKRLYVRPAFRGHGIGRKLLEWVMNEARLAGYSELVGDTMPAMGGALALYERMRFEIRQPAGAAQQASFPQIAGVPIVIRIKL